MDQPTFDFTRTNEQHADLNSDSDSDSDSRVTRRHGSRMRGDVVEIIVAHRAAKKVGTSRARCRLQWAGAAPLVVSRGTRMRQDSESQALQGQCD